MESKPANKICESCGEAFGCGANLNGCWCAALTLSESQAERIKAKFNDCLCPQCLEKIAEKTAMKITYPERST